MSDRTEVGPNRKRVDWRLRRIILPAIVFLVAAALTWAIPWLVSQRWGCTVQGVLRSLGLWLFVPLLAGAVGTLGGGTAHRQFAVGGAGALGAVVGLALIGDPSDVFRAPVLLVPLAVAALAAYVGWIAGTVLRAVVRLWAG